MLKVSRILTALTLYHGQRMTKSFIGKYAYLTTDPGYASSFSDGKTIGVYDLLVPPDSIFSLRKAEDMQKLIHAMNEPDITKKILDASTTGELSWAMYDAIHTPDYPKAEDVFTSLDYKGVWLGERAGVTSILVFSSKDVKKLGEEPAKYRQQEA